MWLWSKGEIILFESIDDQIDPIDQIDLIQFI